MKHVDPNLSFDQQLEQEVRQLRRENEKLRIIRDALIGQVDRNNDLSGRVFRTIEPLIEVEGNVEKRIQRLARAMSEAKIARRQLRQAIDSIGEGFILYDRDDRIVLCNRKYREIFPELEHLLKPGTHFQEIIRHAARIGVIVEAVTDPDAWIASRSSSHSETRCQFQQLLSDGRWIQISERATEDGGKVTIVSDITPFKRLEETSRLTRMAEQSEVLATTLASIAQGVVVFDGARRFVAWNSQAAMLTNLPYVELHEGTTVRELIGLLLARGARIAEERESEFLRWIGQVNKRPPLRLEIFYPGGRTVSANFRAMPNDGFVVTLTDVTTQYQAARMLERSKDELEERVSERTRELVTLNAALQDEVRRHEATAADLVRTRRAAEAASMSKTQFLAAASHDLLQPLNAARLYLFALESAAGTQPEAVKLIDNIDHSLQSTERILGTLLDMSKMDSGCYEIKLADVKLGELFDTLRIEFSALAGARGLNLRIVPTTAIIRTDPNLLRRIVQNFLSNAIKYTPSGRILLGTKRAGTSLRIEIHDTGPGIQPVDRQLIFQEFKRATAANSDVTGLGLGLAIAQRAADLLGQRIELKSEVGRGSVFSLVINAWRTQDNSGGTTFEGNMDDKAQLTVSPTSQNTLIVLENDETVAHAMTTLFDHWQFASVTGSSYAEIEARCDGALTRPSAIIADYHLNGDIDGIEAIVRLRKRIGSMVPAILVTAETSWAVRQRARQNGIEHFAKPVKPAQLRAYLTHLAIDIEVDQAPSA